MLVFAVSVFVPVSFSFAEVAPVPDGGANNLPTADGGANNTPIKTSSSIEKLSNPLNAKNINDVIFLAVDIATFLGVCFAILAIIWVGFKLIMAQGDPRGIEDAKKWFLGIIIGLAILISARVVVEIIQNTLTKAGVVDKNAFK